MKSGLTLGEIKLFKKLNTPNKIQDFINKIPINFEKDGETCMSPRVVLKKNLCHCIEGAFLAAAILRFHGFKPLVVDMQGSKDDWDHVIAVFKIKDKWGAISKTNHALLRYRDPIYKNIREVIMSYFNEYVDSKDKGKKTLRSFSIPVNLSRFDNLNWMTSEKNLWKIHDALDKVKHFKILNKFQLKNLRKIDKIEIQAGKLTEYKR